MGNDKEQNIEIEVTPEMIEAGIDASCLFERGDPADGEVVAVYRAMEDARRAHGSGSSKAMSSSRGLSQPAPQYKYPEWWTPDLPDILSFEEIAGRSQAWRDGLPYLRMQHDRAQSSDPKHDARVQSA